MSILVKDADVVVTMNSRRDILEGISIYIEGNQIKALGKDLNYKADEIIKAQGKVVYPGFINTHHHLYQTLTRNLTSVQNAKLFDWLTYLYEIWKKITPEHIYISTLIGAGELLLTGCTTTVDHLYLVPEGVNSVELFSAEIEAAREIGIRFYPCRGSMSCGRSNGGLPPDSVVQQEDKILIETADLVNKYHDPSPFSMCRIAVAPCSPFSVSKRLMRESIAFARKFALLSHTHLAETRDEEEYCKARFGLKPIDYMETLEWLGNDVWFAHTVHLDSSGIEKLARTNSGVAHCPTSNLRLGSGIAPIAEMLSRGVKVSLAVDGSASNDSGDMLGEIRNCMLIHRVKSGVDSMPAETALEIATLGGSRVLNWQEIGSIEVGKAADLTVIDLEKLPLAGSLSNKVTAPIFAGACHIVDYTIVNGEIVVKAGRLTKIREEEITKKANQLAQKLLS